MNARPRISINAVVFWVVVLTAFPALGYHHGYLLGYDDGKIAEAGICRITCEVKK